MEKQIYRLLAATRWLLLLFYGGLAVALLGFAYTFLHELVTFLANVGHMAELDSVMAVLGLIDVTLIAGLVVMVMLSGFGNFLAKPTGDGPAWLAGISFAALKTKFASTIAAIAAINTLELLLEPQSLSYEKALMTAALFAIILLAVIAFALVDRMGGDHSGH